MFVPDPKKRQVILLFPLKKFFLGAMVIMFSFLHAGKENDSLDGRSFEKQTKNGEIYILDGTIISGAEALSDSQIKIIKKDTASYKRVIQQSSQKPEIVKKENGLKERSNGKKIRENKIEISVKDHEGKYQSLLLGELQATKANGQYKYDDPFLILSSFLEISPERIKINSFSNAKRIFVSGRYCYIRPPPLSVA
ncbi:hypothetical protein NZD88_10145 [Chryseobacterium antibioticum]|uniref:Organic solvent tolerance-like N-terminal domain-containing protein n=1 Tax=Chryseobacterium pyrolae TaxID=2987481 RepID=A0ABT2IGZ6_9FLAO|nr:hypothetical protein [Chryseobacterium pyrolae]MCT2407899.1 hypothetical protein [Chryseobacterium pyrolae]